MPSNALNPRNGNAAQAAGLLTCGLPKRALNALRHGGIRTLEEAAEWSDRDLLSLPNFGRTYVASLRRLINHSSAGAEQENRAARSS